MKVIRRIEKPTSNPHIFDVTEVLDPQAVRQLAIDVSILAALIGQLGRYGAISAGSGFYADCTDIRDRWKDNQ